VQPDSDEVGALSKLYWLSYGGGVNSTALLVLLVEGKLPQYDPWRTVFSDTGCKRPQTYAYIEHQIIPYMRRHGRELEVVRPKESVIERWERLKVTGSRILRSCTDAAKLKPLSRHSVAESNGTTPIYLVGIDASERHRARPARGKDIGRVYPLVDLNIDRAGCAEIIRAAGLCVPAKSGCWCCPYMRVGEVVELARTYPEHFERIAHLELAATDTHGPCPDGSPRTQWHDKPASYWRERAALPVTDDLPWEDDDENEPCECFR
jgi:hypothetical protein